MAKEQSQGSRERILKSAVQLFARKGYASTGVRELAERAEVNQAMVNYFFGSKKELLKVILDTFFSGYLSILEQELTRDVRVEEKVTHFIHQAVEYISLNRDHMIVTLAELPHDDPEIIEYKASWARKAMGIIELHICRPLQKERGVTLSPIVFGPVLLSMMCSRFLFAPVMEQVSPPGYGAEFFKSYPDLIKELFISGINGLTESSTRGEA